MGTKLVDLDHILTSFVSTLCFQCINRQHCRYLFRQLNRRTPIAQVKNHPLVSWTIENSLSTLQIGYNKCNVSSYTTHFSNVKVWMTPLLCLDWNLMIGNVLAFTCRNSSHNHIHSSHTVQMYQMVKQSNQFFNCWSFSLDL